MSDFVISFYTEGGVAGEEISKFSCATKPIAGEIWYIPLAEYPFNEHGSLKRDDIEFVTVKILEVRVVTYPMGRPHSPAILALCEIISKESPYQWEF